MRNRLLRTAFFTALLGYLGFLMVEYLEPGFISRSFSVHLVGAFAAVLGLVWYPFADKEERTGFLIPAIIGACGALVLWNEGAIFGDYRALLAISMLVLPLLSSRLLIRSA